VAYSKLLNPSGKLGKLAEFDRMEPHYIVLAPRERLKLPLLKDWAEEFIFLVSGKLIFKKVGSSVELRKNFALGLRGGEGEDLYLINESEDPAGLFTVGGGKKARPYSVTVTDSSVIERAGGWFYAGDSETFMEYARLTDHLGLTALGIGYEYLAAGRRTSFPHSHKVKEEFAFILKGNPKIWLNGYTYEAVPGNSVSFPPGTNIAHTIINDSEEPAIYLIVGETSAEGDKINYPKHPFRNEQCRVKGIFWEDRPADLFMGPHSGRPVNGIRDHLSFRHAHADDEGLILDIFKSSPNYFAAVEGCEPSWDLVRAELGEKPKTQGSDYRKEFLIAEWNGEPVGVLDLHIHHPERGCAYMGLLLISEKYFGLGLGRRIFELAEDYLKRIFEIQTLKLGISAANDVSGFWEKVGFVPNGKSYQWTGARKVTSVTEYQKDLKVEF